MLLPFSARAFELVFTVYNAVIWPLQPIVHALGFLMLGCLAAPTRIGNRFTAFFLAALWAWTGLVYHVGFFAAINPVAFAFGAAFALQGALLFDAGRRGLRAFAGAGRARTLLAWTLLLYSAALYPLIGLWLGTGYMNSPAFGVTPCTLTLTTLGVLLLCGPSVPARLYVIPIAWAGIGGSAAPLLGMLQDWPLPAAGLVGLLVVLRDRRRRPSVGASKGGGQVRSEAPTRLRA
jgi:hypothetical protein